MTPVVDLKSGYLEINDAKMYYEVAGTGQHLVLVHAGICDRRMWDEQFWAFSEHFQVIRYDLRGYGNTLMPAGDYSHADDLYGLLRALDVKSTILIGCSMGGQVVMDLALDHSEMVSALILVAASVSGFEIEAEAPPQWDMLLAAFKAGEFALAAELDCQIWVDGPRRQPEEVDSQLRQRIIEMDTIALTNEAQQLGREIRRAPAAPRLGEISIPTLIVAGQLDQPDLMQVNQATHTAISGSQWVVMNGVAHLPSMEKPGEFNQLVLDFLSGL